MRNTIVGAAAMVAVSVSSIAPAFAGGLGAPAVDDEVIVVDSGAAPAAAAGSLGTTGFIIAGLVGIALIAALANNTSDTN